MQFVTHTRARARKNSKPGYYLTTAAGDTTRTKCPRQMCARRNHGAAARGMDLRGTPVWAGSGVYRRCRAATTTTTTNSKLRKDDSLLNFEIDVAKVFAKNVFRRRRRRKRAKRRRATPKTVINFRKPS